MKRFNGSILLNSDIYIFAGGIPSDGNLEDFTVGTGGQHYFKLRSFEHLEEAVDQILGESSRSWEPLLALLRLTRSCCFHDEDEDEVRGLCGLHEPSDRHDHNSNRKTYPWAASVHIFVNIKLSRSSCSSWCA